MEYCVPEKNREHYFASSGRYQDTDTPIAVPNYSLWASLNALDTITSPAIVFATKSKEKRAYMYRVNFIQPPNFFDISNDNNMKIFYLPFDRFLQFISSSPCVHVADNNWEECSLRYHAIAAFYRLNVITSLSDSIFEREDLFDNFCEMFYKKYRAIPPFNNALSTIFSNVLFSLQFLGFATPLNLMEKKSIKAAKQLADEYISSNGKNSTRFFAFSEIAFAIERYHKECFPYRQEKYGLPPDVFDYRSYNSLISTVSFVRRTLSNLKMIPDKYSFEDSLRAGVLEFQKKNNLPQNCCDMFTLRHIWNASLTLHSDHNENECDLLGLCKLSGMPIQESVHPVYSEKLQKIKLPKSLESFNSIDIKFENALNQILSQVKNRKEAPQWMLNEAQKSAETQINKIEKLSDIANDIGKVVSHISDRLDQVSLQNEETMNKFDESAQIFDNITNEYTVLKHKYNQIERKISQIRNGNKLLFILIVLISLNIIYKFL